MAVLWLVSGVMEEKEKTPERSRLYTKDKEKKSNWWTGFRLGNLRAEEVEKGKEKKVDESFLIESWLTLHYTTLLHPVLLIILRYAYSRRDSRRDRSTNSW
jgi:hypothetical protein